MIKAKQEKPQLASYLGMMKDQNVFHQIRSKTRMPDFITQIQHISRYTSPNVQAKNNNKKKKEEEK